MCIFLRVLSSNTSVYQEILFVICIRRMTKKSVILSTQLLSLTRYPPFFIYISDIIIKAKIIKYHYISQTNNNLIARRGLLVSATLLFLLDKRSAYSRRGYFSHASRCSLKFSSSSWQAHQQCIYIQYIYARDSIRVIMKLAHFNSLICYIYIHI